MFTSSVISLIVLRMVDALKSSEFSRLRRLAVFNVLCKVEGTRGNGWGITKSRVLRMGGRRFPCRIDRGIAEFRWRIFPNMSTPPPVVNDMSHSQFRIIHGITGGNFVIMWLHPFWNWDYKNQLWNREYGSQIQPNWDFPCMFNLIMIYFLSIVHGILDTARYFWPSSLREKKSKKKTLSTLS